MRKIEFNVIWLKYFKYSLKFHVQFDRWGGDERLAICLQDRRFPWRPTGCYNAHFFFPREIVDILIQLTRPDFDEILKNDENIPGKFHFCSAAYLTFSSCYWQTWSDDDDTLETAAHAAKWPTRANDPRPTRSSVQFISEESSNEKELWKWQDSRLWSRESSNKVENAFFLLVISYNSSLLLDDRDWNHLCAQCAAIKRLRNKAKTHQSAKGQ